MLPMTYRTLTSFQPRLNLASTASLRLTPRRASDMGCLRAPPLRGRCLSNRALLPTVPLLGRAHNAHGRAMPVAMDRDTGVLVSLEGHPSLVPRLRTVGTTRPGESDRPVREAGALLDGEALAVEHAPQDAPRGGSQVDSDDGGHHAPHEACCPPTRCSQMRSE